MIFDGKQLAEEILAELLEKRKNFKKITLAIIVIGNISDKLGFIKAKENFAKKLGIDFRIYELMGNISRKELRQKISQIARAKTINGAIIQLPLPEKFKAQTQYFLNAILPEKDIDCLSSHNLGKFFTDSEIIQPPAVEVVNFIKEKFNLEFSGKLVGIFGYGNLIGKPIAHYCLKQGATIIVVNSKTSNKTRDYIFENGDIIISGVGKSNLITDCKKGATIIDLGYSSSPRESASSPRESALIGDVDFEKLKNKAELITPTPGGTGPILVAMLHKNLLNLVKLQKTK